MLPLLPLAKDGAQREIVEEMITDLRNANRQDLYPLGYALAALVFKDSVDKQWLKERFTRMHDILEESWAYQEMLEEGMLKGMAAGMEKGMEKGMEAGMEAGMEKGMEKGKVEGLRVGISRYVHKRFSGLDELCQQRMAAETDVNQLSDLFDALIDATDESEVRALLSSSSAQWR